MNLGKFTTHGSFQWTGILGKPPPVQLSSVETFTAKYAMGCSNVSQYLSEMMREFPAMVKKYTHPGLEHGQLFKATYPHQGGDQSHNCDTGQLVQRQRRTNDASEVHYGTIGSVNVV